MELVVKQLQITLLTGRPKNILNCASIHQIWYLVSHNGINTLCGFLQSL